MFDALAPLVALVTLVVGTLYVLHRVDAWMSRKPSAGEQTRRQLEALDHRKQRP